MSEWSRVHLRMVAPSWDLSPQRDEWSATLTSALGQDTESLTLVETGERSGVFEGTMELWLSEPGGGRSGFIDTYRDFNDINTNDVITASFGGATDTIVVVPSILQLVDDYGAAAASFAEGEKVHLRLRDGFANTPNLDLRLVTVTTSRGDAEQLQVSEIGIDTGIFEGLLDVTVTSDPPVPGNGALEVRAGDTLTASYDDLNHLTVSTASAAVAPLAIRFLDAAGRPASLFLEGSKVWVRVTNPGGNADSQLREIFPLDVRADVSGEFEYLPLWETGPDSGVFEGWLRLSNDPTPFGDGRLGTSRATNALEWDTLRINVQVDQTVYTATAATTGSLLRLTDAAGEEASAFALGSAIHVLVEDPASSGGAPSLQTTTATFLSLTTGDAETITLRQTGVSTGTFEGSVRLEPGSAATGDGVLQAAPDETIQVIHPDFNNLTGSFGKAVAVERLLRFVDESGRLTSTLLEGRPARLRAFDAAASGQVEAEVSSLLGADQELVFLSAVSGEAGTFEGSIPLSAYYTASGFNGILRTGSDFEELGDRITATLDPLSSVQARTLPARVSLLDDRGLDVDSYPLGAPWHVRIEDPGANTDSGAAESAPFDWIAAPSGWQAAGTAFETGPDTGVFEAIVYPGTSQVAAGGDVTVVYRSSLVYKAVSDRAGIAARSVELVDASGLPTDVYLTNGRAYVRAFDASANTGAVDTLQVRLETHAARGENGDSELLTLTETGADTGLFTGSIDLQAVFSAPSLGDGRIQSSGYAPPVADSETLRVYLADVQDSARFLDSVLRFVDGQGTDADTYEVGSPVRVRLERPLDNQAPYAVEESYIDVFSLATGDRELVVLAETGPDTGVFEASLPTGSASGNWYDGTLQVQEGTIQATREPYYPYSTDYAEIIPPPASSIDAQDDAAATAEDTPVTVDILANDSSPAGPLTVTGAVVTSGDGSVTIDAGSTLTYTPAPDSALGAVIAYTVTDGATSATARLTVSVTPVQDPPVAVDDAYIMSEDQQVILPVLDNDFDADVLDPVRVSGFTQPLHGVVTAGLADTAVVYTPAANYNGPDSFTYTIGDGNGGSATATVNLTVQEVQDPPNAVDDAATTNEDTPVVIDVLANDTDIEGGPLSVVSVTQGSRGSVVRNAGNTVTYTPAPNANGGDSFTYTMTDGFFYVTATVTVTVKDALERVAVLATHGVWIQTGADVLSGDVIVNQSGAAPFLDGGASELSVAGTVTTPAGYDVQANRINLASGSTVSGDAFYNQLTGTGSVTGAQTSPLTLPVFASLPAPPTATPGATDVNVANNGVRTLAPGSYRDLIVGRKGTVTFTGGVYHFRTVRIEREAKLLFSAAAEVRVQQKLSTQTLAAVQPAAGAAIDSSSIVFFVAGANGATGGLAETPKAVEIGTDNVFRANLQAPNGTVWLKDRVNATGAFLGKDVQVGPGAQITLDSYWEGQ